MSDFKRAFSSTRDPTCAMTSSDLPSARLFAAFAIACLTAAPVSQATIGDSVTGGGLSFLRTASLSDSRWSRILAGKASSYLSGARLSRGFGLSAGAEVAGSATLVRRHLPVRKRHGLHLRCGNQSRWHFPSFGFRPARRSGAERPTVGISCARERDSQRAV